MTRSKPRPASDKPQSQTPVPHVLSERFSDADLVDRIFGLLLELRPDISEFAREMKDEIRREWGGQKHYVRGNRDAEFARKTAEVLRLFNGRNATEVARKVGISRTDVYRYLKQPGNDAQKKVV